MVDVSSTIKSILSPKEDPKYSLSREERRLIKEGSPSVAKLLQSMHNMKPLDQKKTQSRTFTGRGMLSILDIILESIKRGGITPMEKRKIPLNPTKPRVGLLMDVSASMSHSGVVKPAVLLATSLMHIFKSIAKDFSYGTIGRSSQFECEINQKISDFFEIVLTSKYNHGGTNFIPVINEFEKRGWFNSRETKYLFIITDGRPETYTKESFYNDSGNLADPSGTLVNMLPIIQKIMFYISERWDKDTAVEYFWIQLGDKSSLLSELFKNDYLPPKKEALNYGFDESIYDRMFNVLQKSGVNKTKTNYIWAEFLWSQFKRKNMFYTTTAELKSGVGFHKLIDYFLTKFRKTLSI